MKRAALIAVSILIAVFAVACGGNKPTNAGSTNTPANNPANGEKVGEEGPAIPLGKGKLLGLEFSVEQNGEAHKGKAVDINLVPVGGKDAAAKYTIYTYWAGEDGKDDGKEKIQWQEEEKAICGNIVVPKDPKGKLMIWYLVEDKDGKKDKAGFEVKVLD